MKIKELLPLKVYPFTLISNNLCVRENHYDSNIIWNDNARILQHVLKDYRKNSKIWDTSNNCHNCPKIGKV